MRHGELRPQSFQDSDFSVACRHTVDREDFTSRGVVSKTSSEDMAFGYDAVERGLDHFLRSGGNHIERELMAIDAGKELGKLADVVLQANAFPDFNEMLLPDAPVVRIVEQ